MILVTFALPEESAPFLKKLTHVKKIGSTPSLLTARLDRWELAILHVGMGRIACERALNALQVRGLGAKMIIAAGVAGALAPGLPVGRVFYLTNYSTVPNRGSMAEAKVLTSERVVSSADAKRELHASSRADLIDMETEWIARYAADQEIPLVALRSISDDAAHDFPVPEHVLFDIARQRPRMTALLFYLITRPHRIGPFARFVRQVGVATEALAEALVATIQAQPVTGRDFAESNQG